MPLRRKINHSKGVNMKIEDYWKVKESDKNILFDEHGKIIPPSKRPEILAKAKQSKKHKQQQRKIKQNRKKENEIRKNPAYRIYIETTEEGTADKIEDKIDTLPGVVLYGSTSTSENCTPHVTQLFPEAVIAGQHWIEIYQMEVYTDEKDGETFLEFLRPLKNVRFDVY